MFPLLCEIFSKDKNYQQLGVEFFNKPFDNFINELKTLQHTNPIQYAVLVLCLVNDSKLSITCLPHKNRQEVFNNCRVNLGTSDELIKDAIYHLSETYFTKLDTECTFNTECTFIHDFMFEAIAFHYGQSQYGGQNQILKCLSSSYIANKVTVYEQASNEDFCIHISKVMYSPLAERLYKDIESMNLFDVFMNKSLKHGPFLDAFEKMLKTKPFDEFESLILRKHENIGQFVQKIPSFKEDFKKQSYIAEHRGLYLLFKSVHCGKSKRSVRVISWIIYYGHTHLLREIVSHVKENKHSISSIFGSNVEETRRLLVLGCYGNTLDMVELILKYVDPKCINMDYNASSDIENNFHRMYAPLMAACTKGNLCIVKALLREKADVNECDDMKKSPLLVAIEYGHMDVVRCLLSSDADVNLCDEYGQSPLCIASQYGHCDIVEYLVTNKADVNVCNRFGHSPLFTASENGHCDIVKYLVAHNADVNLTDRNNKSPLYSAAEMGHYDIVLFLLQKGADVNISDVNKKSSLYVASSSGHFTIIKLLIAHGALSAGNAKSQFKTISKRTNGNEIFSDSNALLNPCRYPEEKISRSKEKQEEEKEGIYVAKAQEGKEETVFTREQEEKEENEETIDRRKEQVEKGELVSTRKGEEEIVEVDDLFSFPLSCGGDALLPDDGNTSPLSIAVQKGHFDIVKYIIENSTDFDLSDTGKSPLFLAAEEGYHDILVVLLHSKYNDIAKTYLGTTPLEIAVWRNKTKVVQLLIQEENKLQKYQGNYHLLQILTDLKRSEFCINEETDKEDCHAKDRNQCHLPYSLWHIITDDNNYYLIHLLKIGLDINKRDYNGNTLLYKILSGTRSTHVDKFKRLMEHFEDVNVEGKKWISLLERKRKKTRGRIGIMKYFVASDIETLSEFRKHIRRHSI